MKHVFLALPLLAACTSLVPSTMAALSGLSPLEADPAGFEVAMSLPEGLDIAPGGAQLEFRAEHGGTGEASSGRYRLARQEAPTTGVEPVDGGRIVTYRFAASQAAELRAQQALIRGWEGGSSDTSGSLSVALTGCLRGAGPTEDAQGALWLRTEPGGEFLPLVRQTPIAQLFSANDLAALPPCPNP